MAQYFTSLKAFQKNTARFGNIKTFIGTSLEASKDIIKDFDFIFIDAGHIYEEVKQDFQLWYPHLKIGGIIAFHDYTKTFEGVMNFVNEQFGLPEHLCGTLAYFQKAV